MKRMVGYAAVGVCLGVALLIGTAALADGSGYLATGAAGKRLTPCMAGAGKADHVYSHSSTCAVAARYVKANADCLVGQLHADHRAILAQMERLASLPASQRAAAWGDFRRALLPHMQAEERTLYPALQENAATRALGMRGEEEHAAAAAVFQKLEVGDFTSDRWIARFSTLREMVGTHVRTEESDVLPAARRALSLDVMRRLCAAFVEQKENALANLPVVMAPSASTRPHGDQAVAQISDPSEESAPYAQSPGFDDLPTQNMTLTCPGCGAALGTVCVNEMACLDYSKEPATKPATAAGTVAARDESEGGAAAAGYANRAYLRCPHCGTVMGKVCSYASNGTAGQPPCPK
jgi:hypothetical protein